MYEFSSISLPFDAASQLRVTVHWWRNNGFVQENEYDSSSAMYRIYLPGLSLFLWGSLHSCPLVYSNTHGCFMRNGKDKRGKTEKESSNSPSHMYAATTWMCVERIWDGSKDCCERLTAVSKSPELNIYECGPMCIRVAVSPWVPKVSGQRQTLNLPLPEVTF